MRDVEALVCFPGETTDKAATRTRRGKRFHRNAQNDVAITTTAANGTFRLNRERSANAAFRF